MNAKIIFGFIACLGFASAGVLKIENKDVIRSILSNTINKTVESLREKLAEHDPLSLVDQIVSIPDLGDIQVGGVEASGFSNFALTSLTATALTSTVTGTLSLPAVVAAVQGLQVVSESLGVEANFPTVAAELYGVSVEFELKYKLLPLQLTSLSALAQVEGIRVEALGLLNGEDVELAISDAALVNDILSDNQEAISSIVKDIANYVLERLESSELL